MNTGYPLSIQNAGYVGTLQAAGLLFSFHIHCLLPEDLMLLQVLYRIPYTTTPKMPGVSLHNTLSTCSLVLGCYIPRAFYIYSYIHNAGYTLTKNTLHNSLLF